MEEHKNKQKLKIINNDKNKEGKQVTKKTEYNKKGTD
jgi:hypothetical protein